MENLEKVRLLSLDLSKTYPRSPRAKLAGYVVAARMLDKCRARITGCLGEYKFNCRLDRRFLDFTQIDPDAFESWVRSGAEDDAVAAWIQENAKSRSNAEIVQWNNQLRYLRISELEVDAQEFLEGYIDEFIPQNRVVNYWFDVYDIEEQRI